jgi:uncharacterized protein YbjT (DUF2867 family)
MGKIATILGGTGLIGSHLIKQLQQNEEYSSVRVLVRRLVQLPEPKAHVIMVDFSDYSSIREQIQGSNAVFCCVGTTLKKVHGDMQLYRSIDYDIPIQAARACHETGCSHYLFVSSVGADSKSRNFYLQLKGEVEDSLRQMNIPAISVFRPSMLLGQRGEFRLAERIGQVVMNATSFLIPSHYRPIHASDVAKAMAVQSVQQANGFGVFHYNEIKQLAG